MLLRKSLAVSFKTGLVSCTLIILHLTASVLSNIVELKIFFKNYGGFPGAKAAKGQKTILGMIVPGIVSFLQHCSTGYSASSSCSIASNSARSSSDEISISIPTLIILPSDLIPFLRHV